VAEAAGLLTGVEQRTIAEAAATTTGPAGAADVAGTAALLTGVEKKNNSRSSSGGVTWLGN